MSFVMTIAQAAVLLLLPFLWLASLLMYVRRAR
jgi:hypothetical protein